MPTDSYKGAYTMAEFMTGMKRTDYCGDLRIGDVGREVTVCGWGERCRDL